MKAIVLSDLHLDAGGDPATEDAFVSFLEWLTGRARSDHAPLRLIVLGDLFDLLHAPAGAADPLDALEAVAARHRSALAALGAAATSGIQVDLVPGNHDSELVDPELQAQLRALAADAAGVDAAQLRSSFRVRPWFVLVPGLLYAEHGSQYHSLNAVADPLAPFGRWSPRLPPGAVLDLGLRGVEGAARMRALVSLLPALLRASAARRRRNAATVASLQAYARETGLSPGALAALRDLSEDSPVALVRNLSAALLGRAAYVESRQQRAAVAVQQILAREGQAVPVYVFGHTHRVDHCALTVGDKRLLWVNAGAWADGGFGFAEVESQADGVAARLWRWDATARSALTLGDPLFSPPSVAQEGAPAARARDAGSRSPDPLATP
jgi:UDP-2,3-diacylglucosamine pyrophosphatase LpxH